MRQHVSINVLLPCCLISGGDEYSIIMGWLRCSLSFSLLRSAIQCVRGARSSIRHYIQAPPPMDLVRVESNMSLEDDPRR